MDTNILSSVSYLQSSVESVVNLTDVQFNKDPLAKSLELLFLCYCLKLLELPEFLKSALHKCPGWVPNFKGIDIVEAPEGRVQVFRYVSMNCRWTWFQRDSTLRPDQDNRWHAFPTKADVSCHWLTQESHLYRGCLMLSPVWLFVTPWTIALQASPSMEFSRQEYGSG